MMRVAFLTANCMIAGHPEEREDRFEHDLEFGALSSACRDHRIELVAQVWNDPEFAPGSFDAVVIGTAWDYVEHRADFLACLQRCERESRLWNSTAIVEWNASKTYLRELEAQGVPSIPTLWRDRADAAAIGPAFDELGVERVVVKPIVGACSWRQVRLRRGQPLPAATELPPDGCLIQPFLPAAATEGELSLIFFGGEFSHGLQKIPREGDYRTQSVFGAREQAIVPRAADLNVAQAILAAIPEPTLYARVDLMRRPSGDLALMELELIEPYLYPMQGPGMGEAFVAALKRLSAG